MIESEISLIMRCDECGSALIDESGHVVNIMDYYADDLYEMAEGKGWSFGLNPCGWLCPDCKGKEEQK